MGSGVREFGGRNRDSLGRTCFGEARPRNRRFTSKTRGICGISFGMSFGRSGTLTRSVVRSRPGNHQSCHAYRAELLPRRRRSGSNPYKRVIDIQSNTIERVERDSRARIDPFRIRSRFLGSNDMKLEEERETSMRLIAPLTFMSERCNPAFSYASLLLRDGRREADRRCAARSPNRRLDSAALALGALFKAIASVERIQYA